MKEESSNTEFKNIEIHTENLVPNIRYRVTEVFIVEHARELCNSIYTRIIFIFIHYMLIYNCLMSQKSYFSTK